MANDYRNESRRRPALEKYGTPGTQYPTPNPYDVIITEEVTNRAQAFEPVLYGTPHPTVAEAVLCYQGAVKGNNTDKAPVRIYANPRLAQEPYNLVNGDDEANDHAYPTFVRSYLLPRGYTKGVFGTALSSLIGLTLVAGGAGYSPAEGTSKLALSFSGGGGGSGAAGFAEIVGGVIVAVVLTRGGGGYTSAPTVSVSGGSGASITAQMQPGTALLTNEVEQAAEEPFGGFFVRVTRTWETLPGKAVVVSEKGDPESGSIVTITRQKKLAGSVVTGFSIVGTSVVSKEKQDIDGITAYEITETIGPSPYFDVDHAKVKDEGRPYGFPAYLLSYGEYLGLTYTAPDFFGDRVGVRGVKTQNALHTFKTWWVVSSTKPTLFLDEITMDDVVVNNQSYACLHDDLTRVYNGIYIETVPATVPTMTEYFGSAGSLSAGEPPPDPFAPGTGTKWIGTEKTPLGRVENDGHPNRWRVDITVLTMR